MGGAGAPGARSWRDMIECNFSCPQMTSHAMGSDVGQSPELVENIVGQ